MKICWFSNAPWGSSGYSKQTAYFVPQVASRGHELAISAFWGLQGGRLDWNGIPIFPGMFDPHGQDIMVAHAKMFQADILFTLYDTWVMDANREDLNDVRLVPWFPVDHEPMPEKVASLLHRAYLPIAMSRSGQAAANDQGIKTAYIPHGVDLTLHRPRHRALSRKQVGFPHSAFVASIVAMNKGVPSRKAFSQQIEGFARFHKRYPDSLLYIHTLMTPEMAGHNLWDFVDAHGIRDAIIVPDQFQYMMGFPEWFMADVFNASDVLLSATMGEGFGIPILEAQANGTPVIVGGWTAMEELCFGGWKLDRETEAVSHMTVLKANQYFPSPLAIEHYLEEAYLMANEDRYALRQQAYDGAKEYGIEKVFTEHFDPTLKKISRMLLDEKNPRKKTKKVKKNG